MPYSGKDDESLPENVKKLSDNERAQWVEVFNSAMKEHDDEGTAFKMANGVLKKKKKTYVESYDVFDRQVSQSAAEYNPIGANDTSACANCNWFVSPDGCVVVSGNISPTGRSKFWLEKQERVMEPIPVVIQEKSILDKIKELIGLVPEKPLMPAAHPVQEKILFTKQLDGRTRFFTAFSNNFKDREKEIILEEAHKEFVDWSERTKQYPELWLWHSGKDSKWGQVDWLDYTAGFICASGLVDEGKEYIAENLSQKDIGVSHGFYGLSLPNEPNVIVRYRSFEISPLPSEFAANTWTNFTTNPEVLKMPFTDARKKFLKEISGLDDEKIANWEKNVDSLSATLKDLGIDYKDTEQADLSGQLNALTNAVMSLTTKTKELMDAQASYSKSLDESIAKVFTAEIAKYPNGFRASENDETKVPEEKQKELKQEVDWFGDVVNRALNI